MNESSETAHQAGPRWLCKPMLLCKSSHHKLSGNKPARTREVSHRFGRIYLHQSINMGVKYWTLVLCAITVLYTINPPISQAASIVKRGNRSGSRSRMGNFDIIEYLLQGDQGNKHSNIGHLQGITRLRTLYCRNGYYLEISPNGDIGGSADFRNPYVIMELITIHIGQVCMRSYATGFYLAMNSAGQLYAAYSMTPECVFDEILLENLYNTYAGGSDEYVNPDGSRWYIGLSKDGKVREGDRTKSSQSAAQFLARHVTTAHVEEAMASIMGPS